MIGILQTFIFVTGFLLFIGIKGTKLLRPAFYILSYIFLLITTFLAGELASAESYPANVISVINYSFYVLLVMFFVLISYTLWVYTQYVGDSLKSKNGEIKDNSKEGQWQ
jgi:hypothetical protein